MGRVVHNQDYHLLTGIIFYKSNFCRLFPTVVEHCQFYTVCTIEGKSVSMLNN